MTIDNFIKLIKGKTPEEANGYMRDILDDDEFNESTSYNIITEIFSQGSCGRFAVLLKNSFPGGKILMLCTPFSHVVYELNSRLYDINGDVTDIYKDFKRDEISEIDALEEYDNYSFYDRGPLY